MFFYPKSFPQTTDLSYLQKYILVITSYFSLIDEIWQILEWLLLPYISLMFGNVSDVRDAIVCPE